MHHVPRWTVFEQALESARDHSNPPVEAELTVRFTAPSGEAQEVAGFWDGGRTWRVRFSPDQLGEWRWQSECGHGSDAGLGGHGGSFACVPYEGENPLHTHGPIAVSSDRRHLCHSDGTPLFWLADTAWNGVIKATEADWQRYLAARREQRFTAVQFVSTHWRASSRSPQGEAAFSGGDPIRLNPRYFQAMDAKVAAINQHGMIAAPVMIWSCLESDPGQTLSEKDAVLLARYLVARWAAHHAVWLLGGDGDYRGDRAERWRRIGRAVFGRQSRRVVSMHPGGLMWVADEFRGEAWYGFVGYQSGHGDSEEALKWLVGGPPSQEWERRPPRPIINLEPNYEAHPAYQSRIPFTDREVRRAAYWSLLIAPAAGVTYGHSAIWPWQEESGVPEGHLYVGAVGPWSEAVQTPGVESMTVLRGLFDSGPWWLLRPAPHLLVEQPGDQDVRRFLAASCTEEGDWAVVYLPQGGSVRLRTDSLGADASAYWFDPRTGERSRAGSLAVPVASFTAPDTSDWVLEIRSDAARTTRA